MDRFKLKFFRLFIVAMLLFTVASDAQVPDGFISARDFAETQGISYQWFPIQKMLVMRKGLKTLKVKVNEQTALVDENKITLPAAPLIQDGQIMVPAKAVIDIFQNKNLQLYAFNPDPQNNLNTPPPSVKPPTSPAAETPVNPSPAPPSSPAIAPARNNMAVLVALRHSVRDDHTRVVLEFNGDVRYSAILKGNVYRLTIDGCRNLIPTRRTNPVGRDISSLNINSGPDRKGLILTFTVKQTEKPPIIETVANPFRMVISFFKPGEEDTQQLQQVASETVAPNPVPEPPKEVIPEISIDMEQVELKNESFQQRTIVIDPGHGGSDNGFIYPGRKPEKEIVLSIAQMLQQKLEQIKLKAVLVRDGDQDLTHYQRVSLANKDGADLFISLHGGSSKDTTKAGPVCAVYTSSGTICNEEDSGISYQAVYNEWLKQTRFDLAGFMAKKIDERFKTHLETDTRGVIKLPLAPLKFINTPAVLVEVGMLSDKSEGLRLQSPGYQEAVAASIANGVADFFNGIVINP